MLIRSSKAKGYVCQDFSDEMPKLISGLFYRAEEKGIVQNIADLLADVFTVEELKFIEVIYKEMSQRKINPIKFRNKFSRAIGLLSADFLYKREYKEYTEWLEKRNLQIVEKYCVKDNSVIDSEVDIK